MAVRGAAELGGAVDGAVFAPSYRLLKRVTIPSIMRNLPAGTVRFCAGDQELRFANGARAYCMGVDRTPEERILGLNLGWAVWDEAGASSNEEIVGLITERLRVGPADLRFVALFTSPHGHPWLLQWSSEGVHVVRATTYSNTHLDAGYIRMLEREYPPGSDLHRQEMLGEIVSRTGLVYGDVFSRAAHCVRWDGAVGDSYVLTVDPGYRASAWLAWQRIAMGPWVVVREWLPEGQTTDEAAARVRRDMGHPPRRVIMDTPSRQNSRLHVNDYEAIRDAFGSSCEVRVLGGVERSSDWRHKSVIAGLSSGALKIATQLAPARVGHNERGLVYSLETMEWPRESSRDEKPDQKDRRKHVVDALEFGAAILTPPSLARAEQRQKHYSAAA
jgi:hypothetical protein